MANPSNISMFLRLVGGNVANEYTGAEADEHKIDAHSFLAALRTWENGEITKQNLIDQYNLTHGDDEADIDAIKSWFDAAIKKDKFAQVLEHRIVLARDKKGPLGLDGAFGFAVKATLINGADGVHSLEDDGPPPAQFNTWA